MPCKKYINAHIKGINVSNPHTVSLASSHKDGVFLLAEIIEKVAEAAKFQNSVRRGSVWQLFKKNLIIIVFLFSWGLYSLLTDRSIEFQLQGRQAYAL